MLSTARTHVAVDPSFQAGFLGGETAEMQSPPTCRHSEADFQGGTGKRLLLKHEPLPRQLLWFLFRRRQRCTSVPGARSFSDREHECPPHQEARSALRKPHTLLTHPHVATHWLEACLRNSSSVCLKVSKRHLLTVFSTLMTSPVTEEQGANAQEGRFPLPTVTRVCTRKDHGPPMPLPER